MTSDEQEAFHKGKFAAWKDHRDQASGARSRCPYIVADRARAWRQGYDDQMATLNPTVQLDAESEQLRAKFVADLQAWLDRNK